MDELLQSGASEHTRLQLKNPFPKFDISWNGSWAHLSRNEWLRHIRSRLKTLADMPVGWDGYGSPKIATDTMLFSQQLLIDMWAPRISAPEISAMSNGSLMAEFRQHDFELTIEISGPYESAFTLERPSGHETSGLIKADISELRAIVAEMLAADKVVALIA